MKIVVLGGNGQLGCSFAKVAAEYAWAEFSFADLPKTDIAERESVRRAVNGADVIINCAAWTAVDDAERNPTEADRVNHIGALTVAETAHALNMPLVHISTDYVFDGNGRTPVPEESVPKPLNVYGQTKLLGEVAVENSGAQSVIIRTSWLYSEFGNNFVKTMLRLGREHNEIKVVDDQIGAPTYAVDLARAVVQIIKIGITAGCHTYHYCNLGATSWCGFARTIFREAGEKVSVIPVSTANYPTIARRPQYSVLDTTKITSLGIEIPRWEEALRCCIAAIKRQNS